MNEYYEYQEVSIEKHPHFRIPRKDWRVKRAYRTEETGEEIPEDRSQWKPEEDGKCLADWWDAENKMMRDDSPLGVAGLSTYLEIVKKKRLD
jgi:hypothetical protein